MKKVSVLFIASLIVLGMSSYAQTDGGVSIGKGNNPANTKSILELVSKTKGLLIPRMTDTERNAIFSGTDLTAKGLMVFDSSLNAFYFWDGMVWKPVASGNMQTVAGTPTTPGVTGDLTLDTQNSLLYIYSGGKWVRVSGGNTILEPKLEGRILQLGSQDGKAVSVSMDDLLKTIPASDIKVTPNATIGLSANNVQEALMELQGEIKTASSGGMNSVVHDGSLVGNGTTGFELKVAPGGITNSHLAAGAVTTPVLVDGAVTTAKLGAGAVGSTNLAADAVTTTKLVDGAVTAAKIMGGGKEKVLTTNVYGTVEWIDKSSVSEFVGLSAVFRDKTLTGIGTPTQPLGLAINSVTTNEIVNETIKAEDLHRMDAGDGFFLQYKLGSGWAARAVIYNSTITGLGTDVSPLGLADGAVTTSKLADKAVSAANLSPMGATDGQVLLWDGTKMTWKPGAAYTGTGGGASINVDPIFFSGNGTTTPLRLADGAVTSEKIAAGAIGAGKLSAMGATAPGQVLQWDGLTWAATTPVVTAADKAKLDQITGTNSGDQTLSLSGNDLSISGGNTVDLSGLSGGGTIGGVNAVNGENYLSLSGETISAAAVDLSGTHATGILGADRFPALSGDLTTDEGSLVTTLKNVGKADTYITITTDEQGRVISGKTSTTIAESGITDANVDNLMDVSITPKQDKDALVWDDLASKWTNKPFSSIMPVASTTTPGLLSASDKDKLDNLTNYSLPLATATELGGIKVGTSLVIDGNGVLNTNGTIGDITGVIAGAGLSGGSLAGDATLSLAPIDDQTMLGNTSGAKAVPAALNATQVKTLLGLENVKNVDQTDASNLSSGTIPVARYGTSLIPLDALQLSGTPTVATYLNGTGTWESLAATSITGIVPVVNGGTGMDSFTPGNYINAGNATTLQQRTPAEVKLDLGLNKVQNTADAEKVVSDLTQTALDTKEDVVNKSTNVINDAASDVKYPSVNAIKTYVDFKVNDAVIAAGGVPDATTIATGKIQLAGDLSGTASAPTVPGLADKEPLITILPVSKGGTGIGSYTPGSYIKALDATTLQEISLLDVKTELQINNVNNTSDADKPVSGATQTLVTSGLNLKIDKTEIGALSGVAPLDGTGKIENKFLPSSLVGAVNYRGTYDAAGNVPFLQDAAEGNKGYYYVVSVAGTQKGLVLGIGDWVISNGLIWDKVASSNLVASVFNRTGAIVAANGDYNTSQVTENTNLYYTEARVTANPTVATHTATLLLKEDKSNKSIDGTFSSTDDIQYPTTKAVKTYVDAKIPVYAPANANNVLTVNASGTAASWQPGGGGGTVTNVSVTANDGITRSVDFSTTTPLITLGLGTITPTSVSTTGVIAAGSINSTGIIKGSNIAAGATLSGSNTGDQTISLSGDVTSPGGTGSLATTIGANKVTYGKMQAMSTNKLLGSGASGTAVSEITLGTGLSFTGTTLNATSGGTGTVTNVIGSTVNGVTTSIVNPTTTPTITVTLGAITPTSVAATGYINGTNVTGTAVNTGDQTITLTGDVTGSGTGSFAATIGTGKVTTSQILDGTITAADIANQTITASKLSNISANGTSGQVLTSNGGGGFTWVTVSGTGDMNKASYDLANISEQLVGLTATQTLTNKTLTNPVINNPTGIVKANVGLDLVDNTADGSKSVFSATRLTTPRTINGVSFDGTANITIPADATKQNLDSDLTALSDLTTTGMLARTGTGTMATRTITNGTGLSVTNGNGVSGNPTIALSNTSVTAGNYTAANITVDAQGRITAAANGAGGNDATTTTKGVLMLANDLGGSASAPTVTNVGGAAAAAVRTGVDLANAATTLSTPNTIVKRDASGAILNLNASQLTSGFVPSARFANSSVPVSAINTTSGTASSTTFLRGDGVWAAPTGGTGTTLPTPAMPADKDKVLTVDAAGAAVWNAPAAGGAMLAYNPSGDARFFCRASGTGVTVTLSGNSHTITVPAGVWLDYIKVKTSFVELGGTATNWVVNIVYQGKEYNTKTDYTDLIFPSITILDFKTNSPLLIFVSGPNTAVAQYNWTCLSVNNGTLSIRLENISNLKNSNPIGDGFAAILHF